MKNTRRIMAIIGIIILVALYLLTFIFALIDTPWASKLFTASAFATVLVPLILWIYLWIAKVLSKDSDESK